MLTLELIIFISAILFGIFIYWNESKGNKVYRFVNKIFNSKELQIKESNKKGFVYKQSFILRLVFISIFFLVILIAFKFMVPIGLATVSIFLSMIVGTLAGSYLATFIFKSSEIIEEQSENLEEIVQETYEKGKDFIEDLTEDTKEAVSNTKGETKKEKVVEEKSARERLKDKGYL